MRAAAAIVIRSAVARSAAMLSGDDAIKPAVARARRRWRGRRAARALCAGDRDQIGAGSGGRLARARSAAMHVVLAPAIEGEPVIEHRWRGARSAAAIAIRSVVRSTALIAISRR